VETAIRTSAVLRGTADPLTKARLLAALLGGAMDASARARWVEQHDGAAAVDELLAAGSVRATRGGGLALRTARHDAALDALARDLGI